jgi:hypothetical protein
MATFTFKAAGRTETAAGVNRVGLLTLEVCSVWKVLLHAIFIRGKTPFCGGNKYMKQVRCPSRNVTMKTKLPSACSRPPAGGGEGVAGKFVNHWYGNYRMSTKVVNKGEMRKIYGEESRD